MAEYKFGKSTYDQELWIDGKRVFHRPTDVNVELVTGGPFDWVFADSTGKEVRTLRHGSGAAGWTSANLPSLGLNGDYSIGFRNATATRQEIKQGDVTHS